MKRRDFLKFLGITSTAAVASSCIEGYHWVGTQSEKLIPYLIPPDEDHIPGEYVVLPTACTECPTQCGAQVKIAVKAPDPAELVKSKEAKTKFAFTLTLQKLSAQEKTAFLAELDGQKVPEMLASAFQMKKQPLKKPQVRVREKGKQWAIFTQDYWSTQYLLILKGNTLEVHSINKKDYWEALKQFWHGEPIKLDGNSHHTFSGGKLCIRGQASLTRLYDPNRIMSPLLKVNGVWQKVSWQKALEVLKQELQKNKGKQNLFLAARTTGTLRQLHEEFCEKMNLQLLPYFEPISYGNLKKAYATVVGISDLPHYHIEKSDFLLSIGADLVETFLNPVSFARQIKKAKQKTGWKWYHVESALSLTGLDATQRVALRAGSENLLLAYLLRRWNEQNKGDKRFPTLLSDKLLKELPNPTAAEVVEKTGITKELLEELESGLRKARRPLVIVGGNALGHEHGLEAAVLGVLLQWASGGLYGDSPLVDFGRAYGYDKVGTADDLKRLLTTLQKGQVGVFFSVRTDLSLYLSGEEKKTLEGAAFRVGLFHSAIPSESYDLLLPLSLPFESFGDYESAKGVWSLVRPVVPPKGNTQSEGDLLLQLLGAKVSFAEYLAPRWQQLAKAAGVQLDENFWRKKGALEVPQKVPALRLQQGQVEKFFGEHKKTLSGNPMTSFVYVRVPALRFYDGRSADLPLLREIPDPLASISYGQWVSLSPQTAKQLGVKDGDVLQWEVKGEQKKAPVRIQELLPEQVLLVQGENGTDFFSDTAATVLAATNVKASGEHVPLPILSGGKDAYHKDVLPKAYWKSEKKEQNGHGEKAKKNGHEKGGHGALVGRGNYMYTLHEYPDYHWAMAIDLDACNGCSACVAACYIENNVPLSGPREHLVGREMSWIRIEPYVYHRDGQEGMEFVPMVCQQCDNAPCESVCPVFAAVHNSEGLNVQVYNRCVGTRYCANNCPYKVRRFNWYDWTGWPHTRQLPDGTEVFGGLPLGEVHNPDVPVRTRGIMEKCTFCVHRIRLAKDAAKDENRKVRDGEVLPACAEACPTDAILFGNLQDKSSQVAKIAERSDAHRILDHELNTKPSVYYLGKKG